MNVQEKNKVTKFIFKINNIIEYVIHFLSNRSIYLSENSKNIFTIEQLNEYLYDLNIPKTTFGINNAVNMVNDAICIVCENNNKIPIFYVFYLERGNRYDTCSFLNEKDACQFFYFH